MFMGELDGLRESRKKGNDALKAAKLKYSVQVCFLEGYDGDIWQVR